MLSNTSKKTVVVGMSGGVDSSVTALLLKNNGYRVIGLHMKGENQETREDDEKRVKLLCDQMNIECVVVDYTDHMQIVKDYFINEYKKGRTPNPCVVCNREVKFKPFLEYVEKLHADFFATGHYAIVEHEVDNHYLKKAKDKDKDQTYFLCQLSKKQIEKVLFPLGDLTKEEVRKIAEENNLISADTRDSYDICFLGSDKFKDFMNKNYPEKAGKIIDEKTGKVVGKHTGISKYTIGQRRGLGIGGSKDGTGESWFVTKKDIINNVVYVTQGNGEELYSNGLVAIDVNWFNEPKTKQFKCKAKFRYRQEEQDVIVYINDDKTVKVMFDKPQKAVTIGQYVVFYKNLQGYDCCLGGGVIDEILK